MNLDELRSVQNTERQKDSLQHLRESFYEDVAAYVADLETERDRAAEEAEDPFASPEVRRLTDEIETAKEVTRAIYERRLGKLVKRASLAAADMPADEEGLTAEERELFSDLVDRMERNKSHVLDVVEGASDPVDLSTGPSETSGGARQEARVDDSPAPRDELAHAEAAQVAGSDSGQSPPAGPGTDETAGSTSADPTGEEPEVTVDDSERTDRPAEEATPDGPAEGTSAGPAADEADGGLADRTTVRITRDVGEIFGVDQREYDLTTEKVVTLPEENAEPLLDRGAAERID